MSSFVWMVVALVGVICCTVHFVAPSPLLTGRTVDGVMGAATLGNAVMFVVNAYEWMTGDRDEE